MLRQAWASITRDDQRTRAAQREAVRLRLAQIQLRLARLTDAYLDGVLSKDDVEQRKTTLLIERRELDERQAEEQERNGSLQNILELADRASELYEQAQPADRRALVQILLSNRLVDGRTPHFRLAPPFDSVATALGVSSGPSRATARTAGAQLPERQLRTSHSSAAAARRTAKKIFKAISQFVATADASVPERIHQLLHPAVERPKHWFGRQAA
jgi:hypothetical protein